MAIDRKPPRSFFSRTKAVFGERMEDYARKSRQEAPEAHTDFEALENFRAQKRETDRKVRIRFRIATVLFGLIFLYVFLRLAAGDIIRFFY